MPTWKGGLHVFSAEYLHLINICTDFQNLGIIGEKFSKTQNKPIDCNAFYNCYFPMKDDTVMFILFQSSGCRDTE